MFPPFGDYLRYMRMDKKVSQRELAEAVGINYTYLSKIENKVLPAPSSKTIKAIAAYLESEEIPFFQAAGLCTYCCGTGRDHE